MHPVGGLFQNGFCTVTGIGLIKFNAQNTFLEFPVVDDSDVFDVEREAKK